jgi:hypothetical protein
VFFPKVTFAHIDDDVICDYVDITFANLLAVLPQTKAGPVRTLGVTSAKRSNSAPGYEFTSWFGALLVACNSLQFNVRIDFRITFSERTTRSTVEHF